MLLLVLLSVTYAFFNKNKIKGFGEDEVVSTGTLQIKYKGTTDFVEIEEPYIYSDYSDGSLPKNTFADDDMGYLVQEGHIFLLGDNRNVSYDSRDLGSFPLSSLDGVVTEWSLKHKSFCTKLHNFFKFKIRDFFGLS